MQSFDIEQLRTLVNVVEAGSVTAGASRVFLSHSAASEQLRKLEERAGHVLLRRSRSGVVPTEKGVTLLQDARRLLAMSDVAWRELHEVPLQGELKLGITDYFRPSELAQLLAQVGARYPGIRLRVTICKSASVLEGYANGWFDIGLAMSIDTKPPTGSLVRKESLRWMAAPHVQRKTGEALPLITLTEGCALRAFTEKLLAQRKIAFDVVHVASGVAGMQAALAAGLGVACLNESALCAGVNVLPARSRMPALRQVSFHLLPGRRGEAPLVTQVRSLLAEHLSTT